MSRTRLAESVGATPAQLSKIESGIQRFPLDLAAAMAEKHGVPLAFFTQNDPAHEAAVPTFRKKARASALDQKRITRLAREAARVFTQASTQTGYKPFVFTDDKDLLDDVEQVALEVRRAAGIADDAPVPNVTRALERQGIAVINGLDPNTERTRPAPSPASRSPTRLPTTSGTRTCPVRSPVPKTTANYAPTTSPERSYSPNSRLLPASQSRPRCADTSRSRPITESASVQSSCAAETSGSSAVTAREASRSSSPPWDGGIQTSNPSP